MQWNNIIIIALAVFSITILINSSIKDAYADQVIHYSQTSSNTVTALNTGGLTVAGENPNTTSSILQGKSINKVTVWLSKNGNPTGNALIGVWGNGSAPTSGNYKYLVGTQNASALTGALTSYTFFNNVTSYTMTTGDVVGVFYSGGSGANQVQVGNFFQNPSGVIDGTNTINANYNVATGNWVPNDNFDLRAIIAFDTDTGTGEETACIDTNLNGVVDMCFTDTNGDGIADNGFAGGIGAYTGNANITAIGTQWFCAFNVGNACSDEDIRTNGVGVLYLIVIIIISYAFLVSIHIMAVQKLSNSQVQVMDYLKINPVLLLVMLVLDVGFTWYLGWTSDIIFYTTIALMAGLAGFGIYKQLRGSDNG